MDYNNEIPFERQAPDYAYLTDSKETPSPNLNYKTLSLHQIEGKSREEQEQTFRKIDDKRLKKLQDRDLATVVTKQNKHLEVLFENKTKLLLPKPQLKDSDLELLGKLNTMQEGTECGSNTTSALIANYSQKEFTMTPMRTPRVTDSIMVES